jgi:hypothetical protein
MIAGDINGHAPHWDYKDHDKTRKYIEELSETTNLKPHYNIKTRHQHFYT